MALQKLANFEDRSISWLGRQAIRSFLKNIHTLSENKSPVYRILETQGDEQ